MKIGSYAFPLIMALGFSAGALSQSLYLLPAHTSLKNAAWYDSIYRYPEFLPGRLTFVTGFSPPQTVLMNYNMYFLSMDFINEEGDTLQVNPPKELALVSVGSHLYLRDDRAGFLEIIDQGAVTLARKSYLATEKMIYVSGSIPSDRATISYAGDKSVVPPSGSMQSGSAKVDERGSISNYDRYYRHTTLYYFVDKKNKAHRATQSAFVKLSPTRRKEIKQYLKENEIDFSDVDDLTNLLAKFQ